MPTPAPIAAGRKLFGRYKVERRLGRGGSAEVWLAHDERLDRTVAIKAPLPGALPDDRARKRFVAEARAAASLSHPAIVPVYDVVRDPATPAMVLRYVEGESLAERVAREGRLPPGEATAIAADLAGALAHAHAAGLVHRDVKPGNVLLDGEGRAQLVDFGIAGSLGESTDGNGGETTAREVTGTLRYMAPEQLRGAPADARSDLYALGLVLYELLAGRPAFQPDTPAGLLADQRSGPPVLQASVPSGLREVVGSLLALDPADRPPDAATVERRLRAELPAADAAAGSPLVGGGVDMAPTIAPGLPAATAGLALLAGAATAEPLVEPGADPADPRAPRPDEPARGGATGASKDPDSEGDTLALSLPATAAIDVAAPPTPVRITRPVAGRAGLPTAPVPGGPTSVRRPRTSRTRFATIAALAAGLVVAGVVLGAGLTGFGGRLGTGDAALPSGAGAVPASARPTSSPTPKPLAPNPAPKPPKHNHSHGKGSGNDG